MITTKTGDDGKSRWQGRIVDKDSALMEAVGTLDELQAVIEDEKIQKDLYKIMGTLAYESGIEDLEMKIEKLEKDLGPITNFLIFMNPEARKYNWIRTVCRRAERRLVSLSRVQQIDPNVLIYINRLSDYLFMLSRKAEE